MNIAVDLEKCINESILQIKSTHDEAIVKQILYLTNNLAFILDQNKNLEYKIAIILEYFEGMQAFFPIFKETVEYLKGLRDIKIKTEIAVQAQQTLTQLIDPEQIDPALVTFWLQRTCNLQEIKCMDTIMLFLSADQQQKIINYDKVFLQDPYFQLLKRNLPVTTY